jgi:hypothetical protein
MTSLAESPRRRYVESHIVKHFSVLPLLLAILMNAEAQIASKPQRFVSRACGFQVDLPTGWKIRASRSQKCAFIAIVVPYHPDGDIEFMVRDRTLDENELGFAKEDDRWIVQGEGSAAAVQIESANWVGLQGTVGSRIYEKGFYRGFGDQTRALIFDRKHRIAEVKCFSGDKVVPQFVKGFEFLGRTGR